MTVAQSESTVIGPQQTTAQADVLSRTMKAGKETDMNTLSFFLFIIYLIPGLYTGLIKTGERVKNLYRCDSFLLA